VLRWGRQIAQGLAAAHAGGLIHRDIKPANLWLEQEPVDRIKILDFGLVRAGADDTGLTSQGVVVGTPAFMAPEQADGRPVDARCDLFSLGVVLYRMATGRLPFQGDGTMALLNALATVTPVSPSELNPHLPPALSDLILRLLTKDPAGRPGSARGIADQLHAIDNGMTAPLPAPPQAPAVSRASSRWQPTGLAAATALAILLPLGYLFGGTLIRFATNRGELVVEVNDPAVEIAVRQNGLVVQDKTTQREFLLTAGAGEVEVYEPASGMKLESRKFTLTRGGKETVTVVLKPQVPQFADKQQAPGGKPSPEAERRTAEWVRSLGGGIKIRLPGEDWDTEVGPGAELPPGRIWVSWIQLGDKRQVGDDDLARLEGLVKLQELNLTGTSVTDAGLVHLKDLTNLAKLSFGRTQVKGPGLDYLKELPNLRQLGLNRTVDDAGLAHLEGFPCLWLLHLGNTRISDAGLVHLEGLSSLSWVYLPDTEVGDNGLVRIVKLPKLELLNLDHTRVTDAGVVHLKGCSKLAKLYLNRTRVTDAGLSALHGLSRLEELDLKDTQVTAAGVAALRKALPKCHILASSTEKP
jgi:hypothetical protein